MSTTTPTALYGLPALQALNAVFSKEQAEVMLSLLDAVPVWVEITQAAYDALNPPDPDTLYVVID